MANFFGNAPAPTFDTPLEMLRACHGRILDQCSTLHKLMHHLPAHGSDIQAQQAATAIMRYFDTAAQFHHQDEESDLFPQLLAAKNTAAEDLIKRLLADHQAMGAAWQGLRACLQEIGDGKTNVLDEKMVANFIAAYKQHIELENTQLLPLASQLLDKQQLDDLGEKMAARRGAVLTRS